MKLSTLLHIDKEKSEMYDTVYTLTIPVSHLGPLTLYEETAELRISQATMDKLVTYVVKHKKKGKSNGRG